MSVCECVGKSTRRQTDRGKERVKKWEGREKMATSSGTFLGRDEYKKQKELEEARKAGTVAPELDEDGKEIKFGDFFLLLLLLFSVFSPLLSSLSFLLCPLCCFVLFDENNKSIVLDVDEMDAKWKFLLSLALFFFFLLNVLFSLSLSGASLNACLLLLFLVCCFIVLSISFSSLSVSLSSFLSLPHQLVFIRMCARCLRSWLVAS